MGVFPSLVEIEVRFSPRFMFEIGTENGAFPAVQAKAVLHSALASIFAKRADNL